MGRYWALRVASIGFRIAGVMSLIATVFLAATALQNRDVLMRGLGLLVPQQDIVSTTTFITGVRWFNSILYAIGLYAIGQACSAILEMKRESEITIHAIISRSGKRSTQPATAPLDRTIQVELQTDLPSKQSTMGYSRRFRQPAPQVPPDDPRRPRTYRKDERTSNIPDSRLPRPKSKG